IKDETLCARFDPGIQLLQNVGVLLGEVFRVSRENGSKALERLRIFLQRCVCRWELFRGLGSDVMYLGAFAVVFVLASKVLAFKAIQNFGNGLGRLCKHRFERYARL